MQLASDRYQWLAVVNTAVNICYFKSFLYDIRHVFNTNCIDSTVHLVVVKRCHAAVNVLVP